MKMYCFDDSIDCTLCQQYCKDKRGIVGKQGLVLSRHEYNVMSLQVGKSLI